MNRSTPIRNWIIGLSAFALLLALLLALTVQLRRAQAAEHTLHETTLAALTDAAEEVQRLALAMDKLGVTVSGRQTAAFLYEAVVSADRARHSLTLLPADSAQMAPVLSWLSRLSDTAGALLTRIAGGFPVTTGEMADLSAARTELRLLHAELDLAREALLDGSPLAQALPPTEITSAPTAMELAGYRALPSEEIGPGAALQVARDFVGTERVVSVAPAPDTTGALPAFGVTVQTADVQLNLEITRRGGKVLLMSPETAGFAAVQSVEACCDAAAAFLRDRGFATMEPVWYQVYDGLCVVTCVHVQEGALVWPDRALVQVRMDTAEVVGLEARNYWKNHIPRRIGQPLLSAQEARAALSPQAEEVSVRPALLESQGQERLCWQFTLRHNDDTYISFIDATTGQELRLEKVMPLEYGAIPA
ncbi:MAG: hypothetical protein E7327_08085 [Clostridiales bacterium]|nr:hypothetical protein [Clostridiales bacterium]